MTEKKHNGANRILLIAGVALAAAVTLALLRPWHEPTEDPRPVINVAYLPIYVDLPLFVAVEKGYFRARDIDVSLSRFQSSPDMAAALVGGRVDAVASIATHSALAIETRDAGKFKIFLVDAETPENPLSSLLVASDSQVQSVSELKGATIGSFPGPTSKLWGPLALEKLGLVEQDYTMQELPIDSHISALETGRIAAVITYEPTATQATEKYGSRKLVPGLIESNVINPWQAGIWIISSELENGRKRDADRFMLAIYDAVDFIRANPDDAKEALSKYTTIDSEIALKTPNIPFTKAGEVDVVTLQKHADLLTQKGMLSREVDVPALLVAAPQDE